MAVGAGFEQFAPSAEASLRCLRFAELTRGSHDGTSAMGVRGEKAALSRGASHELAIALGWEPYPRDA
jgi:hypothetical protein